MTTLAERKARAQSGKDLPRATLTLTFLSGESLYQEAMSLVNQVTDLEIQSQRLARKIEEEADNPKPRKGADKNTPATQKAEADRQIAEKRAQIAEVQQIGMPEHQAECELVGMTSGEWQRWRTAHPARVIGYKETTKPNGDVETGDPIYHADDIELAKVLPWSVAPSCNAADVDALLLDRFITTVGGEDLEAGGWPGWLADAILYQDRRALVRAAVVMQEQAMSRLPKAPVSSTTPSDSDSPD